MKKDGWRTLALCAALTLTLPSWKNHQLLSIAPSGGQTVAPFGEQDGKVLVTTKAYTSEESKVYLKRDLLSRDVQPLQVTIQNNTPKSFSVSSSAVDLPHLEPKSVAFRVSKSALPRWVAWKVAGFLFWPLAIPSTIDGFRSWSAHRWLKKSFVAKHLKDELVGPYSTVTRVLFVPKEEYTETFTVTLIDAETLEPWTYQMTEEGIVGVRVETPQHESTPANT